MKKLLAIILSFVFIASVFPFASFAEDEYSDFIFDDVTVIENTRGWRMHSEIMENGEVVSSIDWYEYNIEPDYVRVRAGDGEYETVPFGDFADSLEGDYHFSSDQSSDNPWGIGTHEVSFVYQGIEYRYDFEIVESPVVALSVVKEPIMEGTRRHSHSYSNEATGEYFEFMEYEFRPDAVTIFYNDDTFVTIETPGGDMSPVKEQTGYDVETYSDQWVDNVWGPGIHQAAITYLGCSLTYEVEITESPVASVSADDISFIEGSGGWTQFAYNEATGEWDDAYYVYQTEPTYVTINYTNGDVVRCPYYKLREMTGEDGYFENDQGEDNRWGVGTHKATFGFMGRECEFSVEITPTPVDYYEIDPITIVQGTNMHDAESYDNETGETYHWRSYTTIPNDITVHFKDGTVETHNTFEFNEMYGYGMAVSNDQEYDHQWTEPGEYDAYLHFLGVDAHFTVFIVEDPVESIFAEPRTIIEGMDCYMTYDWDPETDQPGPEYLYYFDFQPSSVTINYTDGTSLTCHYGELESLTGYGGSLYCDQSYTNPWGVGHHTVIFEYMGRECEYDVEVAPSPVASITAEPMVCLEGADCYESADWNPETGEWDLKYMRYHTYPNNVTVTMTDGTVFNDTSFEYDGSWYNVRTDDDQSYENQWGVGHHTVTLSCGGASCDIDVEIVENPIDRVEFDPIEVQEDFDGFVNTDPETGEEYFNYEYYPEFTVYMKNGDVVRSDRGNIDINGENYVVNYNDGQFENHWGVGPHTVEMFVAGVGGECTVTVVPQRVDHIEISGQDELYLIIYNKDETSIDCKAEGFELRGEEPGKIIGILNTDQGNFAAAIYCDVSDKGVTLRDCNVKVKIGDLESNTLEVNRWARLEEMRSTYTYLAAMLNYFDGFNGYRGSDYNVDHLVWFAVNAATDTQAFEYDSDENGYFMKVPVATAAAAVKYVFGIDVPMSECTFVDDAEDICRIYITGFSGFWGQSDLETRDGGWTLRFRPDEDYGYDYIEYGISADCTLEYISFIQDVSFESVTISGDDTLEISVTFSNGVTLSGTATDFTTPNPAAYPIEGVLYTNEGDIEVEIEFDRSEGGRHRFVDRNVSVTIDGVKSNTLESNAWLKSRLMGNSVPFVASIIKLAKARYDGFDVTKATANELVEFAAYCTGEFTYYDTEFANGKAYIKVPVDVALDIVSYVFGVEDLDLSGYTQIGTQGTGEFLDVELFDFDFSDLPNGNTNITYNEGNASWTVDYAVTSDNVDYTAIKVEAGDGFMIKKITFTPKVKYIRGDVNCDGKVTIKDVLLLRKYLASIEELNPEQLRNAEVTDDNKVTIKDVLKLRKYLANIVSEL